MKKLALYFGFLFYTQLVSAQYDPAAGQPGSRAVHKDSSIIVDWASSCTVQRGWKNIAIKDSGVVTFGEPTLATGEANGGIVSLGDSGIATLTFSHAIRNGQGADLAVFENSFSDNFLELAFVEVSSDGTRFVRFPAVTYVDTTIQLDAVGITDPTKLYNFAGKYRAQYGVPFDLDELKDSSGIDLNAITHVRIIDVVGTVDPDSASRDSRGHIVNDPYPTPFGSGGFDLDAVAVINNSQSDGISEEFVNAVNIFPTIVGTERRLTVVTSGRDCIASIMDLNGRQIREERFHSTLDWDLSSLEAGIYFVKTTETGSGLMHTKKIVIK